MLRRIVPMVCALALGVVPLTASAQAPLLDTFGGTLGYGTGGVLPGNDDGSSAMLSLTSAFPGGLRFFGGTYMNFFVNNNGNITFNGTLFTYTPSHFGTGDVTAPMIAPYWGDVDTRGGGSPTNNYVAWHLAAGLLVVTWHNVGYYSIHDEHRMDFQMIIRNALDCGSGNFDVQFRYNRCEWMAGTASGDVNGNGQCEASETTCVPALAGFDAANPARDYVEIPGSRTTDVLNLCTTSNVGTPGVWEFAVRDGAVICPDAGDACDTGGLGACSLGLTACIGGAVSCAPVGTSSGERCDNIDNDCNGEVDDGALCPPATVCAGGTCVPSCFEGACGSDETCTTDGFCVETACIGVTCGADERCSGGSCVGACSGIVCPHGQQCFAGRCADLCEILVCSEGEVCVDGMCVSECPCRPCAADETCGADGICTAVACDVTVCDPGFYCSGGTCFDGCEGAVCPDRQHCETGLCVDDPLAPDAGPPVFDDAQVLFPDGGVGPAEDGGGTGGDSGGNAFDAGPRRNRTAGACACRVGDLHQPLPSWGWAALAAVGLVIARRRGRRA
jgi:hypothetical protein